MCWFHVGRRHPRTCAVGGSAWLGEPELLGGGTRHRKYTCAGDRDRQGGVPSDGRGGFFSWMRRERQLARRAFLTQRQNPSNEGLTLWGVRAGCYQVQAHSAAARKVSDSETRPWD